MSDKVSDRTPSTSPDPRAAAEVFYDGACPVCSAEIGWYRKMRGAEDVAWRDVANGPVPEGMDRERLLRRFTIRRRDGAVVDGAEGFVALWRALVPTRLLGRLTDRQPFLWLGERTYRLFLRIRTGWRRAA